jgi:hypothetical protein
MLDISPLVHRITNTEWVWDLDAIGSALSRLGASRKVQHARRIGYTMTGLDDLSVYHKAGRVWLVEFTLESFAYPAELSDAQYEDKVDEYFVKYQKLVAATAEILGPPVFDDGFAAPDFPEDQDAVWLAMWNLSSARLMVEQKHEDRELPFRLCVVLTPIRSGA